jgi:Flp pilus assembly protein TadG
MILRLALLTVALKTVLRDRSGGIAVTLALTVPILVGAAGIGVETGLWYMTRRQAQTAADTAALTGALQLLRNQPGTMVSAAIADSARNGFPNAAPNSVTINNPPQSGSYAGNTQAVEAIVGRQVNPLFTALFRSSGPTIRARAVAGLQLQGTACILALDTTASGAVTNNGNTYINSPNCIVAANSNNGSAITVGGNATLIADTLWTVGGYSQSGSSTLTLSDTPHTEMWALTDPYANLTVPGTGSMGTTYSSSSTNRTNSNTTHTYDPGRYINQDMRIQGTAYFNPGTYYLDGTNFTVDAQAVIRCNCSGSGQGVTIVLTNSSGGSAGTVTINGGADVQLQAPSGAGASYAGVLFYQDRNTPTSTGRSQFNGGASMVLNGALYFPSTELDFSGNNGSNAGSRCVELVARLITFIGTSTVDASQCSSYGTQTVSVNSVRLVE